MFTHELEGALVPPQQLAALTEPSDFVVKEHFQEFNEQFAPEITKDIAALAFYHCIDARTYRQVPVKFVGRHNPIICTEIQPPEPIVVRSRRSLGLAPARVWYNNPWNDLKSQFAIEVGSLVAYSNALHPPDGVRKSRVYLFTRQLGAYLASQAATADHIL